MDCLFAGDARKPAHNRVAIARVALDQPCQASYLLSRDQGRAEPAKRIQHDLAALGAILEGVDDQRDGLDGRMRRRIFVVACWQKADSRVVPNVGAAPPGATDAKAVGMSGMPTLNTKVSSCWLA